MTTTGSDHGADFDRWLSRQLHLVLDMEQGSRPRPADARYSATSRRSGGGVGAIRSSVVAAIGLKAAVGGAVVALAAGAAAGTVATGSVNPVNWGQHIVQVVEQCKARQVNVGRCVSAVAQEHGEQVRAAHSDAAEHASPSPKPGRRVGQEGGQSNGAGNAGAGASAGQGLGQSQDQGAGNQSDHGKGKPSSVPSPHG